MTKLNDMQCILLSHASQRENGFVLPPPDSLNTAPDRITKTVASLLKLGLAAELETIVTAGTWREEGEQRFAAIITEAGRAAIRNAFHLALHWVSCTSPILRYPRFLLLDNIEDKGMTEQRSQNFQRLIAAISEGIETDHQIIFTTSMVDPGLDESEMTVGERYNFSNKALKIGAKAG